MHFMWTSASSIEVRCCLMFLCLVFSCVELGELIQCVVQLVIGVQDKFLIPVFLLALRIVCIVAIV